MEVINIFQFSKTAVFFVLFTLTIPFLIADTSVFKGNRMNELYAVELGDNEAAFMFLGYSGVVIRIADKTIIIDPAGVIDEKDLDAFRKRGVDLLLYTHGHRDHFIPRVAKEIFKAGNPIVAANPALTPDLSDEIPPDKLINVLPDNSYDIGEIKLDVIEGSHIGFITLFRITIKNVGIFHGGDSAYVPLKKYSSDLAFLPTGNPSPTASPDDAFRMVSDLKPSVAVAIHGSASQSNEFNSLMAEKMPKTRVIIAREHIVERVTLK